MNCCRFPKNGLVFLLILAGLFAGAGFFVLFLTLGGPGGEDPGLSPAMPEAATTAATPAARFKSVLPPGSLVLSWGFERHFPFTPRQEGATITMAPEDQGPKPSPAIIPVLRPGVEPAMVSPLIGLGKPLDDEVMAILNDSLPPELPPVPTARLILNPRHPRYCFPVSWPFSFRNSFGDPRGPTRRHLGIDIFAAEGTEVYAITDGVIQAMALMGKGGLTIFLAGQDGRGYCYMHLQRFATGLREGQRVSKGEVIGYVGRTGTTDSSPHLHFQVHGEQNLRPDTVINPYEALVSLSLGLGVADLGRPQTHLASIKELRRQASSQAGRPVVYLVDPKTLTLRPEGLDWRVPPATWKIPPATVRVPPPSPKTSPSALQVSYRLPENRPEGSKPKVIIPRYPSSRN